jgi:hypothetical protein
MEEVPGSTIHNIAAGLHIRTEQQPTDTEVLRAESHWPLAKRRRAETSLKIEAHNRQRIEVPPGTGRPKQELAIRLARERPAVETAQPGMRERILVGAATVLAIAVFLIAGDPVQAHLEGAPAVLVEVVRAPAVPAALAVLAVPGAVEAAGVEDKEGRHALQSIIPFAATTFKCLCDDHCFSLPRSCD